MVLKPEQAPESPGGLVYRLLGSPLEFLIQLVVLGWGAIICTSNTFPDYADAAGPGTVLWRMTVLKLILNWHISISETRLIVHTKTFFV